MQKLIVMLTDIATHLFPGKEEPAKSLSICAREIFNAFSDWRDDSAGRVSDALESMEIAVRKALDARLEIVFLPCRASWWKSMENAWKYACGLNDANIYVCPIPWYEKPSLNEIDARHDESSLFPDSLQLTSAQEYDIKQRHPEVIVTQFPYDNTSLDMITDEDNYSYRLRNHTDRLIYIPPFVPDSPAPDEIAAQKALYYLIEQPAVVFSDIILLPTERMREVYIQHLTDIAGEETKQIWESKIRAEDHHDLSVRDTLFHNGA